MGLLIYLLVISVGCNNKARRAGGIQEMCNPIPKAENLEFTKWQEITSLQKGLKEEHGRRSFEPRSSA
jgi:hypothetical protein